MKKITQFFWFCSGAHTDTLIKNPTEHNKYVGIGATIFFTALFATLSGGYAMYFVFSGSTFAVLFAILFGLIWGLSIFNMDRYIVASIKKTGSSNKQIWQAMPRILLAIMIGIIISRPLELKIFDKEIRQKLKTSYLNGQRSKIDTLNNAFNNKYSLELAKYGDLKDEKDSLEKDINKSRYVLNQEVFGDKTNQTSGVTGYGTYAKQKEIVVTQKVERLNQVRGDLTQIDQIITSRKEMEGLNSTKLFSERQLDSLANVAGFADRNYALGQLSFNPNGTRDLDTYLAVSFISFLFILLECLPVFVKLMSDKGPYDIALQDIEDVYVYKSAKDKEHKIIVIDDLHGTKNNLVSNKKKILLKQRIDKELGEGA
jgi:hypothetical protein